MDLPNLTPFFRMFDGVLNYIYQLDVVFGMMIFIIALMISFYSYKIYKFSNKDSYFLFSSSFFIIAFGFLIKVIFDLMFETERLPKADFLGSMNLLFIQKMMLIGYMLFVLAGYILLLIVAMKTKKRVSLLIFIIAIASMLISNNYYLAYNVLSIIVISTLLIHFDQNFSQKKTLNAGLVWYSFILILFGYLMQLLIFYSNKFYLLSNLFNICGFLLLLANFLMTGRK